MIPLRDNIPARTTPWVNFAVIGVCSLVFLMQLFEQKGDRSLVEQYGMIPARVMDPGEPVMVQEAEPIRTSRGFRVRTVQRPAAEPPFHPWWTLLTCIFLHGGWLHFLGNMWFLWIFGDNVEDRLGHFGFIAFYVGCGVAASAAHLIANPASPIPTIGASGAIAGVMGAYFLLYPRAQVLSLVPIFFFIQIVVLPAPLFLGIWFLIQFFQGAVAVTGVQAAGVAWWAHIGGFAVGFLVALGLKQTGHTRPPVTTVRGSDHPGTYRYHR